MSLSTHHGSTRHEWFERFTDADPDTFASFLALTPEDCQPLLEHLKHPRVSGVVHISAENRVFEFGDVLFKFFRPGRWSLDALQDEVDFLNELREDGLDLVCPIGTPGTWKGTFFQRYETVHPPFGLDPEVLTPDDLRKHVHLVARMHQVGARRVANHRPTLDPQETPLGLLDVVRGSGFLPTEYAERYAERVVALCDWLRVACVDAPIQRIHNDPGSWNVLWRPQGPLLMDLDDFMNGPVAADLAIMSGPWRLSTLSASLPREERGRLQREEILRVYREIQPFPEEWEQMFTPLRLLRGVFFDAWFSTRWKDPAFAQHYPDDNVTDPRWWERRLEIFAGGLRKRDP